MYRGRKFVDLVEVSDEDSARRHLSYLRLPLPRSRQVIQRLGHVIQRLDQVVRRLGELEGLRGKVARMVVGVVTVRQEHKAFAGGGWDEG
jgi:hypothetical protein